MRAVALAFPFKHDGGRSLARACGTGDKKNAGPAMVRGARTNWNGEGFLKPGRNNEALTTPSGFPRTGGMPSV